MLYLGGHAITRDAMRTALARGGIRALTAVTLADAEEALAEDDAPTCVLIDDEGFGEQRAIEAVESLLKTGPDLRVAVLSASRSAVYPADVVRAGAIGYLTKESGLDELRAAIERMAQGQLVVDPFVTRSLFGLLGADNGSGGRHENGHGAAKARLHLSPVERKVMGLVAEGKANKQIGSSLGLSPLTVKNHLARIRARLGANDKAQALAIAMRAGLLD